MFHWLAAMQELFLQLAPSQLSTAYPQRKTALSQTNLLVKSLCQKRNILEIISSTLDSKNENTFQPVLLINRVKWSQNSVLRVLNVISHKHNSSSPAPLPANCSKPHCTAQSIVCMHTVLCETIFSSTYHLLQSHCSLIFTHI